MCTTTSHPTPPCTLLDSMAAAINDADFELAAAITGQDHRWIVERGTAD